jgi:hypothetical protein
MATVYARSLEIAISSFSATSSHESPITRLRSIRTMI